MVDNAILALGNWGWLVAAALLMILELIVPGTFLMWFGLAAATTGLLSLAFVISWQAQTGIFALLSVVFVIIGRTLVRRFGSQEDSEQFLNRRVEGFVGRTFILSEPIVDGIGRVRVDDSVWRVHGPDTPVGIQVKVVRVNGADLIVTPL